MNLYYSSFNYLYLIINILILLKFLKYRILGSMANSEEFSKAFNCKKGSRMNPENKCKLW